MTNEPISFSEKLKKVRAQYGLPEQAPDEPQKKEQDKFDKDLVPDALNADRSDTDRELDQVIENIDILDAYKRWCGKSSPKVGNKREGIKVSCPIPGHPDKDPSAWLNLDKKTWYCGGCEEGGDAYDIAAYHFGYPIPGYKDGAQFHKLRIQMAESFGYHIEKVAGGTVLYQESNESPSREDLSGSSLDGGVDTAGRLEKSGPERPSEATGEGSSTESTDAGAGDTNEDSSNVSVMYADDDEEEELVQFPAIKWRDIVTPNTFLWEYMEACSKDDSPEEYHFWHGLIALGHAVGRKITLEDHRPVYGNLLVCLLGATGTGKTRSRGHLNTVVNAAMHYQNNGMEPLGVKLVPTPASGEALIKSFEYISKDPSSSATLGYMPINGIVDYDELAGLLSRANRQGAVLKPTIMELADCSDEVSSYSLTNKAIIAREPFCSITATTQPKAIRSLLHKTDTASGFLNRWVFAGGRTKERDVIGGRHARSGSPDLDVSIKKLKGVAAYAINSKSLALDDDAYTVLESFYRTVVFPTQAKDDSDLLKRLDLLLKKLCLLFAINERRENWIPVDIVQKVIKLWPYLLECYGILDANLGITQSQEVANQILRHARRHYEKTGRGITANDIRRYTNNKMPIEQIRKALDNMVALQMLEIHKPKSQVGRPTVRYTAVGE